MNNSLMGRLDRARSRDGEYDQASYALADAVCEWIAERLAKVQAALTEGTLRAYTNHDGSTELVEYEPGWDAVAAQMLSP